MHQSKSNKIKHIIARPFVFTVGLLSLCGCAKLHLAEMKYNAGSQCYTHPWQGNDVALRHPDYRLVQPLDSAQFIDSLQSCKYKYPFILYAENADLLSNSDYRLAEAYALAQQKIATGEWAFAQAALFQVQAIDPNAPYFSDYSSHYIL